MAGFIISFLVGGLCVALGISNILGNISSIHFYHRHRVSDENKSRFGKKIGLGSVIIGGAIMIFSALSIVTLYTKNNLFTIIGAVILAIGAIIGIVLSIYAMIKYNKGIF